MLIRICCATQLLRKGGRCNYYTILSHNEIKCFNKVGKFFILIFWGMIYTYKLFKAFPPYFTGSSLAFVNKALTECILNLLDPSTASGGGGQLLPIFIDLVSTNILLAILGFPLSPKNAC